MLKSIPRAQLIFISYFLFNAYIRKIKIAKSLKCNARTLKFFRNGLNASLFPFIQTLHCSDSAAIGPGNVQKNNEEAEKNVTSNIYQSDEYFKIGNYEESYKVLLDFEDLGNAEVLWRMARSLYNMSKQSGIKHEDRVKMINQGFELVERALKLDNENYAVHKWMAIMLDAKTSMEGIKPRIKALPDFKKHLMYAMELNPKDATSIYILGQYCYNIASMPWYQKKIAAAFFGTPPESTFEEALYYFNKAEEVEPNFYSLNLLMLGKTYLQLNKIEAARYWLKCASAYPIRTDEDKEVRKEAEKLLKKYCSTSADATSELKGTASEKSNK